MATPVFPLRLRDQRLRELVREVAAGLGISQNELIERATEHEVVARGAMLSEDLRLAADRMAQLTEDGYQQILDRGVDRVATGEAQRDQVSGRRITRPGGAAAVSRPATGRPSGLTDAFEAARSSG